MSQFKKIVGFGLWKKKGNDGSTYYSGKAKIKIAELGDQETAEIYVSLSQSEKRQETSPDLWLTVKVKEDDGSVGGQQQPPAKAPEQEEEIPF